MKRIVFALACCCLGSCSSPDVTFRPEGDYWTPIQEKEKAVSIGMTKDQVEKKLGGPGMLDYRGILVDIPGKGRIQCDTWSWVIGRAGQTWIVSINEGKVVAVKYLENPGDK